MGILIALLSFYSLAAYNQIGVFQSQVGNFENQMNQLEQENAQLNAQLQAINQTINSSVILNPGLILNPNTTISVGHEDLEFTSANVTKIMDGVYAVNFTILNNGTVPFTLNAARVIVNGRPAAVSSTGAVVTWGNSPLNSTETLNPGETDSGVSIKLRSGAGSGAISYKSGRTVEIVLVTENSSQFPKDIVLP